VLVGNYLKVTKRQQVLSLLELGWTYRRIEAETGVRRETVARYDRLRRAKAANVFPGSAPADGPAAEGEAGGDGANPAKVFAGSPAKAAKVFPGSALPERAVAAPYRDAIREKLDCGLSLQRIWQDLVEEYAYGGSYESVKRYARRLERPRRVVGVYHSAPGEEAQVDFFRGAPTFRAERGHWERPWVFRMTLCHSRHGYEEAVWDQRLPTFLALHEHAFRDLGGVPRVIRHDNTTVAVIRACLFDPDGHDVYTAFARHWGFTALPTRPRTPQENGKQERSGGYVKDNALKGRRFESLEEQNAFLRHWNRTIARLRIHGTTRQQVWTHFLATDRPALGPLAPEPFRRFESGERVVHADGHIEVLGAFYPAPPHLVHQRLRVRWDAALVRLFAGELLVAVHARVAPGQYAPRPGGSPHETTSTQRAAEERLLARCARVGPPLRQWAEAAIAERGVRAYRVIQGVLGLTRIHARAPVLAAAEQARTYQLFRYKDLKRLTEQATGAPPPRVLLATHESIRALTDYRLETLP
jgi:transposase